MQNKLKVWIFGGFIGQKVRKSEQILERRKNKNRKKLKSEKQSMSKKMMHKTSKKSIHNYKI